MKTVGVVCLMALLSSATMRAQNQTAPQAETKTAASPASAGSPVVLDRVIAIVNGQVLLQSDVDEEQRLSALEPLRTARGQETLNDAARHLILRTLVLGPAHGHTIAQNIERSSENALEVEQGSLYPALHRLEDRGSVSSEWGVSENNRKAKFYRLTNKEIGRAHV